MMTKGGHEMPKLSSLALSLAMATSIALPGRAELLKNFKTDGSIEVKTFGIDNETDRDSSADDYRSDMRTRLLIGGVFDLLDDVHGRVLLRKNNRLYGQAVENVNSVETALAVDNAWVKIDKVFGRVDMTLGRQFYGDPREFLMYFGTQPDDLLSVTAVDAVRADADFNGWVRFQGLAGKLVESTPVSASAPAGPSNVNSDTDIYGGTLSTEKVIPKGMLGLSYYTSRTKGAGVTGNNTLTVTNVHLAGDILSGFGYQADYLQNFGRNRSGVGTVNVPVTATNAEPSYNGNAYFLGLNFGNALQGWPVRARLEYGHGSRNFVSVAPGRRFGIIWGEHSNVGPSSLNGVGGAGLSNLTVYDAGIGVNPIERLGIDLNAYRFRYSDGSVAGGLTSAGTEYDLVLSWKHSDNVSLEANAATFQVGDALDNTAGTPTNPITRLGADIKIKF
jgi:hypothetical protein